MTRRRINPTDINPFETEWLVSTDYDLIGQSHAWTSQARPPAPHNNETNSLIGNDFLSRVEPKDRDLTRQVRKLLGGNHDCKLPHWITIYIMTIQYPKVGEVDSGCLAPVSIDY